jgi:hypothetical protein
MLGDQYHKSFKLKMQITPDDMPMYAPTSNEDVEILGIYARLPDRSGKSSPERRMRADLTNLNNYDLWIRLKSHMGLVNYYSPIPIRLVHINSALKCFKPETQLLIGSFAKNFTNVIRDKFIRVR